MATILPCQFQNEKDKIALKNKIIPEFNDQGENNAPTQAAPILGQAHAEK